MIANHEIIESTTEEAESQFPTAVSFTPDRIYCFRKRCFHDCGDALNNATSEAVMSELFYSSHSCVMNSVSKCKYRNVFTNTLLIRNTMRWA